MKYLLDGEATGRLLFRKIQQTDFNDWLEFHKNPETSRHWVAEKEDPESECRKWYEKQLNRYATDKGGMNAIVEKFTNKLTGHCGLLVQEVDGIQELEIAYSFLPAFWGKGYAAEAASHCKEIAFANRYADSLISIVSLTNEPSQKVASKLGMAIDKTTIYNQNPVYIFRIRNAQP